MTPAMFDVRFLYFTLDIIGSLTLGEIDRSYGCEARHI